MQILPVTGYQPEIWKVRRSGYQLEKDLPNAEHLYTDRAEGALRASLACLQDAIAAGEVWVGRKDLYFRRDEAEVQPEGVYQAQNELYRKIGRIQLPTLLLELDSRVHFSWKLLSREPNSAEELLSVYGALLAAGTDLQSRGVATSGRGWSYGIPKSAPRSKASYVRCGYMDTSEIQA